MGYRSDGMLYLSDEALAIIPEEVKKDLAEDWTKNDDNIWSFEGWKWYSSYPTIVACENFMDELDDKDIAYEFIRVGEEYEDIERRQVGDDYVFCLNRTIEVY